MSRSNPLNPAACHATAWRDVTLSDGVTGVVQR
jgi:hypothetical protein